MPRFTNALARNARRAGAGPEVDLEIEALTKQYPDQDAHRRAFWRRRGYGGLAECNRTKSHAIE